MTTRNSIITDLPDAQPELAFRDTTSRQLYIGNGVHSEKSSQFFAHHIVRNPQDLLAHVQRINLAICTASQNDVFGALLDLYIVLGKHGRVLRKSMLDKATGLLDDADSQFLADSLDAGINARDVIPGAGISILGGGYFGRAELVTVSSSRDQEEDPLSWALGCIEVSDLEQAQLILEEALSSDPSNLEQQQLLLELYRETKNKAGFATLYPSFNNKSNPAQVDWQELDEYFNS